jgi:DNA polymerase III sliding clamp (beta) subunit (PCNA family)
MLNNAMLQTREVKDKKVLTINGTDLEIYTKSAIFLQDDSKIKDWVEMKVVINIKKMISLLKAMRKEEIVIDITSTTERASVTIENENGSYQIDSMIEEGFPEQQEVNNSETYITGEGAWKRIEGLFEYCTDDDLRPVMTCVHIVASEEQTYIEATDAHKLARIEIGNNFLGSKIDLMIPPRARGILKTLKGENIKVRYDDKNLYILNGKTKISIRLTEGQYPNVSAVIPEDNDSIPNITCSRLELISVLTKLSISLDSISVVIFKPDGMFTKLSAENLDMKLSAREDLATTIVGEPSRIGFNPNILKSMLRNMTGKDVKIRIDAENRAALLFDDNEDTTYLLMPSMINKK